MQTITQTLKRKVQPTSTKRKGMRAKAAGDGETPAAAPRFNLKEQLAWAEKVRQRADENGADKENCLETIQRGRDVLQKFQAMRARSKSSTKLSVVPTPRIRPGVIPPVSRRPTPPPGLGVSSSAVDFQPATAYQPAAARSTGPVRFTRTNDSLPSSPAHTIGFQANAPASYTRVLDQPTVYGEADADADLFEDVDVDALVANHQRKQNQTTQSSHQARSTFPTTEERFVSPPMTQNAVAQTATNDKMAEELRQSIKQTREHLRKVREECDDASLEGEVPDFMQKRRTELERELEALSKRYRDCKSGATSPPVSQGAMALRNDSRSVTSSLTVPPSDYYGGGDTAPKTNPSCSCGMATVEARVQHGSNAKRLYYRCSNCGFHSWADNAGASEDRYSTASTYQTREVVVEQPCVSHDPSVNSKMQRAKRVLRDVFGHNAFRPNQERTVMEAFGGRDVFVLMPTGGGKSLCFQLPACVDDGVTIVISPLVSLIQDQVQQLEALDVGVANLNGDQDYETVQRPIISELFSNRIRIKMLYVTPEKIASSNMLSNLFESLEKRGLLARFVIDEAHCISQWGHDFRKDYMNLGTLRSKFPSVRRHSMQAVPIMALTATANTQTESDIVKNLQLSHPFITRSSFNRPNLTYDVRKKTPKFMNDIAEFVRKHIDDSGIIYWYACRRLSKKDCEQTAKKLIKALGFEGTQKASQISFYHAGLEPDDRHFRHHEWSKGKIKLIIATVAFGMGINKPDVRYVIHHTIPQSVTHYYQDKSNKMGFTTTFLSLGNNSNRLLRGERVRIVCKTRYQPRALASEDATSLPTKVSKKKAPKKVAAKKTKATGKRKAEKKASAKDVVEELNDDFEDDVVEISPPPSRTAQYPLIPAHKSVGRIPESDVEALAQLLKDWRASVCDNFNVMPYHILPTSGIAAIANAVPVTNAELLEIDGVGRIRVKKYGESIIQIVKAYLEKNNSNRRVSLVSVQPASNTGGVLEDDALDDINWDAVDETVLNQQTSSSAVFASRKRALDMADTSDNAKKRQL
ncbi:hypothetical protein BBJ28_00008908 [Nothophytophthora sp. Chile5]|nr:hypothetical protein BBJ28_00008908 [Nothophytophthora sp. Chile5]